MIVVDTHTWLWWVSEPARLGRRGRQHLDRARAIGVPAICCVEVAALAAKQRIVLDRPALRWMSDALDDPRVELLPLSPAIAVKAADLPSTLPGDPADRLIVATAILESATLITKDERLREFAGVRTVW